MIATRQRPKGRMNPLRYLLPLVAIAALTFALVWGPSQRLIGGFIINGPLAPVWKIGQAVFTPLIQPLHFAAQEQVIADRNRSVETLNGQLEEQRKQMASRDQQIVTLQNSLRQAQAIAARAANATPAPAPPVVIRSKSSSDAAGATADQAPPSSSDPKRAAQVWSAMEPAQAAAVAQRLPAEYTAKVLALMGADSAGQVLGALPTAYAARVSQVKATP